MKLILNSFFLFLFFINFPLVGKEINNKYIIKLGGLKIGTLDWNIKINNETYSNSLSLKNEGIFSALYAFEGKYFSQGHVMKKQLKPRRYSHFWKTNKANKNMTLIFGEERLSSLKQSPIEKENLRVDVFTINKTKDPLSSFLQIIMGGDSPLVVDGRRLYKMNKIIKQHQTTVEITNYINLWADHKKNSFEKIIFEKNNEDFLPSLIFIYFDGKVFKLFKD